MPSPGLADSHMIDEDERKLRDSKGGLVPNPGSYTHVLAYTAGKITTDTFNDGVFQWQQTYTYTGDDLTGISQWVRTTL